MILVQTEEKCSLGDTPTCLDATPTWLQEDRKNIHVSNYVRKNKKK
jgi:hypothetical protein